MAPPVRCCRCNGTAKCLRCACVRRGTPCTSCLPGDGGTCHNRPPSPPRGDPSSNTLYPASQPTGPPPPGSFISPAFVSSQPVSPPASQPTGPLNYPATLNSQPTTVPFSSIPNSQPTTGPLPPISISQPTTAPLPSIPNSQPTTVPLPSISTILQAPVPTLKHIPKGVRDRWARVLGDCFSSICDNPDDLAPWSLVLMVSKCILSSPPLGHRLRWREISKLVKARISRWQAGEFSTLWKEALDGGWSLQKRSKALGPSQQRSNNIRRAKQAVQDGQYSKAIKALTSDGLADHSAAIVQEMLSKHPQVPPPALPPGLVPPSINLNEQAVLRGAKSFPIGSAPGPSGFRPSHLKEAAGCPSPDQAGQFLSRLTRFVNLLAAGRIPPSVIPHLCGATLLASRKKNGGHRPIAVGEVLRRLVSKCLAAHTRQTAVSILSPLQLGVGVKGGCEAIVHAIDQALFPSPDNDRWTLLLDFSNAFNAINREAMFREFRRRLPGLSAWMEVCYSQQPLFLVGGHSIMSCCGVQQGDPLGPLGFALTLQPLVERIKSEVSSLHLNAWYLDDGTLIGPPESLAAALHIVERDGPAVGLHLNRGKSLLHVPNDADVSTTSLPSDIPTSTVGFTLLGCPIGPPSYCEDVLQSRVNNIKDTLKVLCDMEESQLEMALLRSCLSFPKISYILRTCPPGHIPQATKDFDSAIRGSLEDIIGGPCSEWSGLKASLPSSRGGLNLREASLHAPAAFIASSAQFAGLVGRMLGQPPRQSPHLAQALADLSSSASRPDWQQLEDIDVPIRQHHLSRAIDDVLHHQLTTAAPSTRARALALSTALPHAGDWLIGVPSAALGLRLQDREFRACLRYWLGVPLHSSPYVCPECKATADEYGDHQVGCGGNGDRIYRHNAVRDVLYTAAQSAALAPSREPTGVVSDSLSRPADILIPTWHHGRSAALDVHIISPLQQSLVNAASFNPGHALNIGVQRKLTAHLQACRANGIHFLPIVAETLGGLGQDTIHLVRSLGKSIAQQASCQDSTSPTSQLFHRLAIALWRGNACLWIHRQQPLPPSVDGVI